jgi:hypothetical protein
MDIRFVSTLTAEDEERVAEALLAGLVALLEGLPITYAPAHRNRGREGFPADQHVRFRTPDSTLAQPL